MAHMLEMRPGCERCDTDLPPDSRDARICSFECTFCSGCTDDVLSGTCPNCGGTLVVRPTRRRELLDQYPAAAVRTYNPPAEA